MSSFGRAPLTEILGMLKACAPEFKIERKKHHFWVRYKDLVYRGLPTGGHGEKNPEIQAGVLKQMVRQLGIDPECAKKHLPILK